MANRTATSIGVAGLGFIILWSGVTNTGIFMTIQSLIKGTQPTPGPSQKIVNSGVNATNSAFTTGGTQGNGTASGSAVSNAALRYDGVRYVWGGSDPSGWDCYGFMTYVLHHDLGYNLPNNTHSGYLEMLAWGGARSIDASQIQAGDLILWPTHCGIAVSSTEMISAENPSKGTRVDTFANGGPLAPEPMTVRRIIGAPMMVA